MSYQATGADAPETDSAILARLDERTAAIAAQQQADASSRKTTVIIAAVGALFAALKLGIIAIPHLRRHLSESNPGRRRRRR